MPILMPGTAMHSCSLPVLLYRDTCCLNTVCCMRYNDDSVSAGCVTVAGVLSKCGCVPWGLSVVITRTGQVGRARYSVPLRAQANTNEIVAASVVYLRGHEPR